MNHPFEAREAPRARPRGWGKVPLDPQMGKIPWPGPNPGGVAPGQFSEDVQELRRPGEDEQIQWRNGAEEVMFHQTFESLVVSEG